MPCYHTYALMREDADLAAIEAQSDEFFERHRGEGSSERNGYFLQALADLHLGPPLEREVKPSGSMTAVLSFSAIAVFILILACINFVNLATARASLRAREIGVRKSVGASRAELFGQFIGESVLIAALAAIAAVGLAALALPVFGNFVRQPLGAGALAEPAVIAFIAASAILVGLAAGAYPSLFLSGFRPVRVLRGDITRGKAAGLLRKCLVIGQFAISVALIVAAIVVYQQMRYAQTLDLGYGQDQVVLLSTAPTLGILRQWDPMREALIAHPEIVDASVSQQTPGNAIGRIAQVSAGTDEPVNLPALWVEFGFFETYGIEMAAGRPFSEAFGIDRVVRTDSTATASFVISELAARRLGADSPEDMVGRPITVDNIDGTVVGVARDIHFESLREVITPLVYAIDVRQENSLIPHRYGSIRITGNDLAGTLEHIDTTWREFEPDQPIARRFLDQDFQALYEAEERQGNMLLGFSLLAIFIACLGLFGLATFAIEQRRKEIGIRKAVGGTVFDIVRIFLTEFASLVLLASLIAWPVAYFAIVPWLENFAYRIDLGLLPFAGATAAALLVACLTVGAAALRAAMAKPIHALRYE